MKTRAIWFMHLRCSPLQIWRSFFRHTLQGPVLETCLWHATAMNCDSRSFEFTRCCMPTLHSFLEACYTESIYNLLYMNKQTHKYMSTWSHMNICSYIHELIYKQMHTFIHACAQQIHEDVNTWIHNYMNTWIHDNMNIWIHGYKTHAYTNTRIREYMIHKYMNAWLHEQVDIRWISG